MKQFYLKLILITVIIQLSFSVIYAQTALTTVSYSGFQSCGGCTVCGADYWCTNTPGSYCGDTPPCQSNTFFDPVPAGNTVTGVTINYYTASCQGASFIATISGFAVPIAYDGASGCLCDDLPCMMTTSVTANYPCGMPGYIYGGTNTFQLCSDGPMCINRAELIFTYYPTDVVIPTISASGPLTFCAGGSVTLTADNGYSAYHWSNGSNSQSITVSAPGTYTVTVTGVTGCTTNSASVTVSNTVSITPTFNTFGPYCVGAPPGTLPTTSNNGITGTWSPSTINTGSSGTTTYTFTPAGGQCAINTTRVVTVNPNTTPTFNAVGSYCQGATIPALPTTSTNGITGTWSPAINNNATTVYTFTPTAGLCATTATLTITITPGVTPTFNSVGPYCAGAAIPALPTTSTNGITGTWSPAINNTNTAIYTFTPTAGQCAAQTTLTITITPNVTPTFNSAGPYCSGASIPALPTTSTNGITGTWSPAINNSATTTYIFTPTAGLCANSTTSTINISNNVTPTFTALGPYCIGSTPGVLPTTSTNGIAGTWNPAAINTSSAGSTVYTFTPTNGLCATTTTMTVVVSTNITPVFTTLGPYCVGAAAGILPATSNNGITGTWSPSAISTSTSGTTVYTFTPTAGLCAIPTTMSVTVNPNINPLFTALGPYCVGATPGTLPTTSNNGITGTWSPSTISTSTSGTTTYIFTPTAGSCASPASMSVTVNPNITPTFTALGPYCVGATPGTLATTSNNGITGTWSPSVINTSTAGTTTYTFTPTAGLCATTTTMSVTVNSNMAPTFPPLGPYCVGATPGVLPTTSSNGITGTWNPTVVNTSTAGTTTYSFTPTAGLCAIPVTMTVAVNMNNIPVFNALGPYCVGATPGTLPTTSNNSITGTWSPSTINTSTAGTTVYTFTPTAGQCATTATMSVTVNSNISPTFTALGPYCVGATPGTLPTTSTNGITGTWSPATINTSTAGTTTFTFTPTAGLCATTATMSVTVSPNITPTFTALGPYCVGATPGVLPTTSSNGITGTWSPSVINTSNAGNTTYTFTPSAGLCALPVTMTVVVNTNILPVFNAQGPYCINATPGTLPTTSNNGITGTWNPSTISTSAPGTTVYTFTPTAGLCATTTTMSIVVSPSPGINAGADADIGSCQNSNYTMNPTSPNTIIIWAWTPSSSGLSATNIQHPIAHPSTTTTYTVIVTDNLGCTASDNITITVHPLPSVDAGLNDSIGSCATSIANLNGIATGSLPFGYAWAQPNGLSNATISNPTAKPQNTTTYVLTVTDVYGCTASDNVTIIVKPLPTINAGSDTTIGYCNTSVALLNGIGTGTDPLNYLWSPTTGIQSPNSPITNAKPSSTETYILTITDRFGCTATDNVTVNVSNLTAEAGPDIPIGTCSGSFAQMDGIATGDAPFTYNWSPPAGLNNTNIHDPIAQPANTTIYSLVVSDFYGCTASDAMVVSVNVFDETVLHFTMEPSQGCEPLTTSFSFSPNNQIVPNSWIWDFGDATAVDDTSNLQNTAYTFENEGYYIATLTVINIYGCTASYSDTVRVSRKPIADFTNVPQTGSSDNPRIEFFDQSSYANHWHWNFGDPSTHQDNEANTQNSVHIYSDSGLYKVILIVSNNEGCSDTAEKLINIFQSFAFFIPNAFTPNEDDVNEVFLPKGVGCRTKGYLMLIYDRWGKQLFKNEDLYKGWDGLRPNGDPFSQGVYTYLITVFEDAGKKHVYKGIVTIVSPDHNH